MQNNTLANDNTAVQAVRKLEKICLQLPQVNIETTHNFWAGCYARTIMIPEGVCITGAQIKIPTMLIVSGDVLVGDNRLTGYQVLEGNIGRKNAFLALKDTYLTMIFATNKTNVNDVEEEFTNESEKLGSRREV